MITNIILSFSRSYKQWVLLMFFASTLIACGGEEDMQMEIPMEMFEEEKPGLSGLWKIDRAKSDSIEDAVEKTIASEGLLTRSIARGRLNDSNDLHVSLEIEELMSSISIIYDDIRVNPVVAPSDGTIIDFTTTDGDDYRISHEIIDGVLVEIFRDADGDKTIEFSLSDDGQVLTMSVNVVSPRLDNPLDYDLVFNRAE